MYLEITNCYILITIKSSITLLDVNRDKKSTTRCLILSESYFTVQVHNISAMKSNALIRSNLSATLHNSFYIVMYKLLASLKVWWDYRIENLFTKTTFSMCVFVRVMMMMICVHQIKVSIYIRRRRDGWIVWAKQQIFRIEKKFKGDINLHSSCTCNL